MLISPHLFVALQGYQVRFEKHYSHLKIVYLLQRCDFQVSLHTKMAMLNLQWYPWQVFRLCHLCKEGRSKVCLQFLKFEILKVPKPGTSLTVGLVIELLLMDILLTLHLSWCMVSNRKFLDIKLFKKMPMLWLTGPHLKVFKFFSFFSSIFFVIFPFTYCTH